MNAILKKVKKILVVNRHVEVIRTKNNFLDFPVLIIFMIPQKFASYLEFVHRSNEHGGGF